MYREPPLQWSRIRLDNIHCCSHLASVARPFLTTYVRISVILLSGWWTCELSPLQGNMLGSILLSVFVILLGAHCNTSDRRLIAVGWACLYKYCRNRQELQTVHPSDHHTSSDPDTIGSINSSTLGGSPASMCCLTAYRSPTRSHHDTHWLTDNQSYAAIRY